MDKAPQIQLNSTSHYFLEGLNEIGIDYLFCNLGTDHAPLIEEMARWQKAGRKFPKVILCPHENTAMHMAAGVANVTGRGQAVIVHVDAGTANCAMGAHNLRRARLPVLLIAGKAPYTVRGELPGGRDNYVHFIQEPYDQGSIVRNYVKWEWSLPSGVITKEVLRRAHTMAHSDPPGPVHLMLPRETLAEDWDAASVRSFPEERYGAVRAGTAPDDAIKALAARLLAAEHPVICVAYAGRNTDAPALIERVAVLAGIRVYESHPLVVNIARDSDHYLGSSPGEAIGHADMGMLIDVDVPWIPKLSRENPATWWAHIDIDVVKQDFPMWGFATNLRLQGDSTLILRQLVTALEAAIDADHATRIRVRNAVIGAEARARRMKFAEAAKLPGTKGAINPAYFLHQLNAQLAADDIIVNEAVRNVPTVLNHMPRIQPGSYIGFAGGGLGCATGIALGAKLARPGATTVAINGDGGFYFNNPSAVFAVAKQYRLPILSVIIDNGGWSAVKEATLRMYADGDAFETSDFQSRLAPDIQFADVCRAAGGYGETLLDPADVASAIGRALAEVRGGRAALLHVKIPAI